MAEEGRECHVHCLVHIEEKYMETRWRKKKYKAYYYTTAKDCHRERSVKEISEICSDNERRQQHEMQFVERERERSISFVIVDGVSSFLPGADTIRETSYIID